MLTEKNYENKMNSVFPKSKAVLSRRNKDILVVKG